jgi:hypothetical protein
VNAHTLLRFLGSLGLTLGIYSIAWTTLAGLPPHPAAVFGVIANAFVLAREWAQ